MLLGEDFGKERPWAWPLWSWVLWSSRNNIWWWRAVWFREYEECYKATAFRWSESIEYRGFSYNFMTSQMYWIWATKNNEYSLLNLYAVFWLSNYFSQFTKPKQTKLHLRAILLNHYVTYWFQLKINAEIKFPILATTKLISTMPNHTINRAAFVDKGKKYSYISCLFAPGCYKKDNKRVSMEKLI